MHQILPPILFFQAKNNSSFHLLMLLGRQMLPFLMERGQLTIHVQ